METVEKKEAVALQNDVAYDPSSGEVTEAKLSKRNKGYDLADVRQFTERNAQVDYKILLALYEHRALTSTQLKKGWFPDLHENSIRNRTKTLAERRILTVNVKPGIKTRPIKLYSLSAFGLRIVTENILQVMEYVPQYDKHKEHYSIDDLKVRSQHLHHYELQEWVMSILEKGLDLFHCEWKRFPFLNDEKIKVKPDWLFLESDEGLISKIKDDVANNPLLYPYFHRKVIFKDVTFSPTLCVECDRGTMSRTELIEKWEGYRALPEQYKPQAICVFYTPKSTGDVRHRLIRDTLNYAFELEVIGNELQLFEGDHHLTQKVVTLFFERNKELLAGEDMTNENELIDLVAAYNRSYDLGDISVLDVTKTVQHLKLPLTPDVIIAKQGESTSIQFVFYAIAGWVNPFIKIQALKRWMAEGNLSQFTKIDYILLYPDNSFLQDIKPMDDDLYFVSYSEIKESEAWGRGHFVERKHRQVKWREVLL